MSDPICVRFVDLKKLTYQCASPIVIRVFPVELHLLHRRHAAAMAAPRLGSVLLINSVLITERFSTAVEKALGPIPTLIFGFNKGTNLNLK